MRESLVTCQFVGRLGNQLWQIGATVNYGLKHNMKIRFPNRTANDQLWPMMFKGLPRTDEQPRAWVQPDDGGYYDIPYFQNGVKLRGFFQSYKYLDHPGTLKKMKEHIGYEDQEPKKGVAIHVRRGDYLKHKDAFPPLPIEYYQKACDEFEFSVFADREYHIFSDDIKWCKEHFTGDRKVFHETGKPVDDLFEMSRFEHTIIANSSYSYWAAMLNPNPNKIVVCPHHTQYYGPANAHLKTVDLYPPEWREVKF